MDSRNVQELVLLAGDEAERLGHEYVGTEHVLLALTRPNGTAGDVLKRLALDADSLRTKVESSVQRGTARSNRYGERPLTQRTQTAFGLARLLAAERGDPRVTPAHVLVGLLREQRNIAAQVLTDAGMTEVTMIAMLWPATTSRDSTSS